MDITQIYNNFANEWTGQHIDYDHVDGVQCVDLIKQYLHQCFGLNPGAWGNAINYWSTTNAAILTKFVRVSSNAPQIGDIVILNFDHIGISNGVVTDTTFEQLDQNGGTGSGTGSTADGDDIRVHTFKRSSIAGILRPVGATVSTPAPAAAPAPPAASSPEGTINVTMAVPGYETASDAVNHANPRTTVQPRNYYIYNRADGMVNVTVTPGAIGIAWINPSDIPAPAPSIPSPATGNYGYDGNSIIVQPGWGISSAAEAAGWPDAGLPTRWAAIAELNGSNDWQTFNAELKAGTRIIVGNPNENAAAAAPSKPADITYTKLDESLEVAAKLNPTSCWKLDFTSYANAVADHTLAQGEVFTAYGKAQRTDLDQPIYYMTQEDFGNADTTGVPVNNRGVNIVDLGAAPAPAAPPANEQQIETPSSTAPAANDEGEKIEVKVLPPNLDVKYNFKKFMSPQRYTAVVLDADIKELQERKNPDGSLVDPNQQVVPGLLVTVGGAYYADSTYKKVIGYRTAKSIENNLYYFIPESDLIKEDDISADEAAQLAKEMADFAAGKAEKAVKAAATADGFITRLIKRIF